MSSHPLVRLIVFVDDEHPGVLSVDVSVGAPVGDYSAEEVQTAAGICVDHLGEQISAIWNAVRAESN